MVIVVDVELDDVLVLVDDVLVGVVGVVDWSTENRQPLAGGRKVVGLLIGGEGSVVGEIGPEVVVVVEATGAVVEVVESTGIVVEVEVEVELVVAVAPGSIRSKAKPTTSSAASETFRTRRRGQRRGDSSWSGGLGISRRM